MATYRVYLRSPQQHVTDKTITTSRMAALVAFGELVDRTDLDGHKLAAVLSCDQQQIAYHRFDRQPVHADYWRGRLEDIQWTD